MQIWSLQKIIEVKGPSVVPIKGPFEMVSFNHLSLERHFNMATMIILTPKCILEADISHVEHGGSDVSFHKRISWFVSMVHFLRHVAIHFK